MPASMTIISSPYSRTVMFLPISLRPPREITRSFSLAKISAGFLAADFLVVFFLSCCSSVPDRFFMASEAAFAVSWAIFMACCAVLRGVAALGALEAADWLPRRRAAGIFAPALDCPLWTV